MPVALVKRWMRSLRRRARVRVARSGARGARLVATRRARRREEIQGARSPTWRCAGLHRASVLAPMKAGARDRALASRSSKARSRSRARPRCAPRAVDARGERARARPVRGARRQDGGARGDGRARYGLRRRRAAHAEPARDARAPRAGRDGGHARAGRRPRASSRRASTRRSSTCRAATRACSAGVRRRAGG